MMSINVQSPVAPEIESLMAEYEEQIRYCTLQIGRLWEQNEEYQSSMRQYDREEAAHEPSA